MQTGASLRERAPTDAGIRTRRDGCLSDGARPLGLSVAITRSCLSSRRHAVARPATDGAFVMSQLPPGEYFLAAASDLRTDEWFDPTILRELASAAVAHR